MKRSTGVVFGLVVCAVAVWVTYIHVFTMKVVLKNTTNQALDEVVLFDQKQQLWKGTMAANQTISVRYKPNSDGAFRVLVKRGNDPVFEKQHGYYTPGLSSRCFIEIKLP